MSELRHLAIIMDGNRRWAGERGLPQREGHRAGLEALERVVRGCLDNAITHLTLYAFSTENWRRSEKEVAYLLDLMEDYLGQILHAGLASELFGRVNFTVRGDTNRFRRSIVKILEGLTARGNDPSNLNVAIALNYGARAEIVEGINKVLAAGVDVVDEDGFGALLDHHGYPDPDLIVRTSGVQRLSNFLLWQSAYSEFLFVEEKWPDLTEASIAGFVSEFGGRDRRYGA